MDFVALKATSTSGFVNYLMLLTQYARVVELVDTLALEASAKSMSVRV